MLSNFPARTKDVKLLVYHTQALVELSIKVISFELILIWYLIEEGPHSVTFLMSILLLRLNDVQIDIIVHGSKAISQQPPVYPS